MEDLVTASNWLENLQLESSFSKVNEDLRPIREQLKQIIQATNANLESDEQTIILGSRIMKCCVHLEDAVVAFEIETRRNGYLKWLFGGSSQQSATENLRAQVDSIKTALRQYSPGKTPPHDVIEVEPKEREISAEQAGPQVHEEAEKVVGKKDEIIVAEVLIKGGPELSIVSICGGSGTGKTKLARRVFSTRHVSDHFPFRAWVRVSQVYHTRVLLLNILGQLPVYPTASLMYYPDEELAKLISQTLKGNRYLIVLDDIWSPDAWLSIRMAFPSDDTCSRILITTRTGEVASAMGVPKRQIFNMKVNQARKKAEEELLKGLTGGSMQLSFISICGMGGTGKTALAENAFNSREIVGRFQFRAWLWASKFVSSRDLLLGILVNFVGPFRNMMNLSDADLAEETYRNLKGKKYLIVLDDIESLDSWLSIRIAFPSDDNGSRILLTTRTRHVALDVGGPKSQILDMDSTSADEEAWESLKRKAGLEKILKLEPDIEETCKKIVMHSRRKPLVGIMLNTILAAGKEYKEMLRGIVNRSGGQEIRVDVLKLGYYALPPHLRPCLRFLGHFPKDFEIETDTLYQLWIAEGLVSMAGGRDQEKTLMDVAARYLGELAEGSWVQIQEEQNFSQGTLKSCYLDDDIRDCLSKLDNSTESSAFRRAISLDKFEKRVNHLYGKAEYLRSLLLFSACQSEKGFIRPREIPNVDRFIWLRVLYLFRVDFKDGKFPKGVEKLIYLRFLSFKECYLVELSTSVGNMLYLQTLDLRVRNECEMTIPHVLGNLVKLRYLYLPLAYRSPKHGEKLKLGNLVDLEIVQNFNTRVCDAEDLSQLTKLTDLSVSILEDTTALEKILNYLDKKPKSLISLDIRNCDCYSEERRSFMKKLFNCSAVHALGVEGHLDNIPNFSSTLTKIVLNGSELKDDPMQILRKLPNLRILVLEIEAYIGKNMKCSLSSFPELRYLKLSKLYNLEEWEMEKGAMKNLRCLAIQNCKQLQMSPEGLKFITGLANLEITSMPQGFIDRIRESYGTKRDDFDKSRHARPNIKIDGQPLILKERQQAVPGEDPQPSSMFPVPWTDTGAYMSQIC